MTTPKRPTTVRTSSEKVQSVNSQITDAITQTNTLSLGLSPAQSMGTLYQTTSHAIGTSIQNSVSNQHNMHSLNLAALTQSLQSLLTLPVGASARARGRAAARHHVQYVPVHPPAANGQNTGVAAARNAAN